MVESEGKSYSGSESEASDSESEELALASEEGAESPYFSADIMASSESTDMEPGCVCGENAVLS